MCKKTYKGLFTIFIFEKSIFLLQNQNYAFILQTITKEICNFFSQLCAKMKKKYFKLSFMKRATVVTVNGIKKLYTLLV